MVRMLRIHPFHLLSFQILHCNFPVHPIGRTIHDTVIRESTTILICSVFAVIFWVSSGIGIVFKTVCPTRWSCCMIFYRPAPGSSAFLFIPRVPSNSLHLISTGPFFFPHSLPTSRIRYEIHRFILSIMLTYEIRSLLLFGLKFRTSKNMGFFG